MPAVYDDEDEWSDDELDEDFGNDSDDDTEVVTCPRCRADVYEDAERCPACGEWIVHGSSPLEGRPSWYILLGLFGVVAVVLVLSGLWRLLR